MSKRHLILMASVAMVIASCGEKKTEVPEASADSASVAAPVETKKANTEYKPAFEGQTRVAGVKTSAAYDVAVLDSS
ncbi:MAG TPA: hypothetical protein VGD40_07430, partial [Chryseosolibacter sp.]